MALRNFIDSTGNEWQAFDVVPRADERRQYDRRTSDGALLEDIDDRRDGDRRLTVGRASQRLGGPEAGWLCFEHDGDRRRLAPIPDDWRTVDETRLEEYCRAARPVKRVIVR